MQATAQAQQYLSFLQGSNPTAPPRHRGIIEAVLGPCRYKVHPQTSVYPALGLLPSTRGTSGLQPTLGSPDAPPPPQVFVPGQNCAITLALTGLTAPSTGRDGAESEPFAQDAMDFAKESYYHRDVC